MSIEKHGFNHGAVHNIKGFSFPKECIQIPIGTNLKTTSEGISAKSLRTVYTFIKASGKDIIDGVVAAGLKSDLDSLRDTMEIPKVQVVYLSFNVDTLSWRWFSRQNITGKAQVEDFIRALNIILQDYQVHYYVSHSQLFLKVSKG